jgi:hypothetical protein
MGTCVPLRELSDSPHRFRVDWLSWRKVMVMSHRANCLLHGFAKVKRRGPASGLLLWPGPVTDLRRGIHCCAMRLVVAFLDSTSGDSPVTVIPALPSWATGSALFLRKLRVGEASVPDPVKLSKNISELPRRFSWGRGIRTPVDRFRICSPTTGRFPNAHNFKTHISRGTAAYAVHFSGI